MEHWAGHLFLRQDRRWRRPVFTHLQFRLTADALSCARGSVRLADVQDVRFIAAGSDLHALPNAFEVVTPQRTWQLCADTPEELDFLTVTLGALLSDKGAQGQARAVAQLQSRRLALDRQPSQRPAALGDHEHTHDHRKRPSRANLLRQRQAQSRRWLSADEVEREAARASTAAAIEWQLSSLAALSFQVHKVDSHGHRKPRTLCVTSRFVQRLSTKSKRSGALAVTRTVNLEHVRAVHSSQTELVITAAVPELRRFVYETPEASEIADELRLRLELFRSVARLRCACDTAACSGARCQHDVPVDGDEADQQTEQPKTAAELRREISRALGNGSTAAGRSLEQFVGHCEAFGEPADDVELRELMDDVAYFAAGITEFLVSRYKPGESAEAESAEAAAESELYELVMSKALRSFGPKLWRGFRRQCAGDDARFDIARARLAALPDAELAQRCELSAAVLAAVRWAAVGAAIETLETTMVPAELRAALDGAATAVFESFNEADEEARRAALARKESFRGEVLGGDDLLPALIFALVRAPRVQLSAPVAKIRYIRAIAPPAAMHAQSGYHLAVLESAVMFVVGLAADAGEEEVQAALAAAAAADPSGTMHVVSGGGSSGGGGGGGGGEGGGEAEGGGGGEGGGESGEEEDEPVVVVVDDVAAEIDDDRPTTPSDG